MAKCPNCEEHELKKVKTKRGEMLACNGGKDGNGKQLGCGFWGPIYKKKAEGQEAPVTPPVVVAPPIEPAEPAHHPAGRGASKRARKGKRIPKQAEGKPAGAKEERRSKTLVERISEWF